VKLAPAPDQRVIPDTATEDLIIAAPALQAIGIITAVQSITAIARDQRVIAKAANQRVIAIAAINRVIATKAEDSIVSAIEDGTAGPAIIAPGQRIVETAH
jgi:hypothetical protein